MSPTSQHLAVWWNTIISIQQRKLTVSYISRMHWGCIIRWSILSIWHSLLSMTHLRVVCSSKGIATTYSTAFCLGFNWYWLACLNLISILWVSCMRNLHDFARSYFRKSKLRMQFRVAKPNLGHLCSLYFTTATSILT